MLRTSPTRKREGERRLWAAITGALTALLIGMQPPELAIVPWWTFPVVSICLLVPVSWFAYYGRHHMNTIFAFTLISTLTFGVVAGVVHLIMLVLKANCDIDPGVLLRSAVLLWLSNVFVFSLWYWRLDAGGPNQRDIRRFNRTRHAEACFLFPQMNMSEEERAHQGMMDWHPEFPDYLFLAFCTSTALSPTDTSVLSRSAKLLVMAQALISLILVAVVAARAVNMVK